MSQVKVLFADDHIPGDEIADNEIEGFVKKKYQQPAWTPDLYEYFQAAREVVNILRKSGYEVIVANTYQGALDLIQAKGSHFDIAIVDLNWMADINIPRLRVVQPVGGFVTP